ncbi:hypothetical protein HDU99_005358 [Rhizoclosmatium hyalinum]|nr:hypothetical protein HDU99_005358 [Rhizoclosmatium hyalinum]
MWNITPTHVRHLFHHGFAVVDAALSHSKAADLRNELVAAAMATPALLSSNSTVSHVAGARRLVAKHNIAEFDLEKVEVARSLPALNAFASDPQLARSLNSLSSIPHLSDQSVKAQINFGGGACFPCHADTDPSLDKRRVTAIMYLNEEYTPKDGGALRLYPFPASTVDVEPTFNRLVLFSSAYCVHRVLPSITDRLCFTIWLNASANVNGASEKKTSSESSTLLLLDERKQFLLQKDNRLLLTKLVFAEEWAQSIVESHKDSADRDLLLETHVRDVIAIERKLKHYLPDRWDSWGVRQWNEYFEGNTGDWF